MKFTLALFICVAVIAGVFGASKNGLGNQRNKEEKGWKDMCECADSAVKKMQQVLKQYAQTVSKESLKKSNRNYRPPALNAVLQEVEEIANDCTRRDDCRCPEGYFKTLDKSHCLKISTEEATCSQAAKICAQSMSSQLVVAKNSARLSQIADYIREQDALDTSHYWIGLSYNRTEGGLPVWQWEDGTKASYAITRNLNNNVKKSLLTITGLDGENNVFERVAINKDYEGTHYRQESCLDHRRNPVKHRFICEFVMFRVHVKPQSSVGRVIP